MQKWLTTLIILSFLVLVASVVVGVLCLALTDNSVVTALTDIAIGSAATLIFFVMVEKAFKLY